MAAAAIKHDVSSLTAQQLAITAWAFGRLERNDSQVVEAIAEIAVLKIKTCSARDIANILWACARLVYRNDELEVAVSQEVLLRPEDFGSQDVSNLAWACAKLLWRRKHFLQGLETICMKKAAELQVQACASTV